MNRAVVKGDAMVILIIQPQHGPEMIRKHFKKEFKLGIIVNNMVHLRNKPDDKNYSKSNIDITFTSMISVKNPLFTLVFITPARHRTHFSSSNVEELLNKPDPEHITAL